MQKDSHKVYNFEPTRSCKENKKGTVEAGNRESNLFQGIGDHLKSHRGENREVMPCHHREPTSGIPGDNFQRFHITPVILKARRIGIFQKKVNLP